MIIIIFISRNVRFYYPVNKFIISQRNNIIFYELKYYLKSNNSEIKYNKSISFRSVVLPVSKHVQNPKAKNEVRSGRKKNLEDKSAKRYAGIGFEGNNYSKQDNLIYNSRFFINFVVSKTLKLKMQRDMLAQESKEIIIQ